MFLTVLSKYALTRYILEDEASSWSSSMDLGELLRHVDLRNRLQRPPTVIDDATRHRPPCMVLSRGQVPRSEGVPRSSPSDAITQLALGVPECHRLLPPH